MTGPKAPKDPTQKRQGFYIMRNKEISGSVQPDGTGVQFIYLNDGRMISSAKIVGNITDNAMLDLLSTTEGFRQLVHSIGISVEMDGTDKKTVFELQMYGSGTTLRMEILADGMEHTLNLSDCEWSDDDDIPGQIRFVFDEPQKDGTAAQAQATVKFYLNDGFSAPEPDEEERVDFACGAYQEMLQKSLVQTGDNARLKTAIERAKQGEDITIAFIGGSITQGAGAVPINTKCYAWQTFEGLCRLAGKGVDENIHYIKAGVGGTPSELGMIRYERDVCRDGAVSPDIVVVEFAVNDEGDETKGICYESLVRKILAAGNKPAVILLFAVFANDWNLQERLAVVGEQYHLPMVSTRDCVVDQFYKKANEGRVVTKNQFFYDCFHPTNIGHKIMADGLLYMMQKVDRSPMDEDILDLSSVLAVIGDTFEQVWLYDRSSKADAVKILSTGDFSETDEELQGVEMDRDLTQTKQFPYNWKHVKGAVPFVMEVNCTSLVMVNKDSGAPNAGCAQVFVDGEAALLADPKQNGWTHCNPLICFQNRERRTWRVEVRMQPGDEDKEFTILGFGVVS
ncbi:MAG: SGNH/GDSL hydrolase family protein [Lachnospiraceae bacterium]|nr:SGNH/GDSL hydrolase family protein [Lachnospiraceae bacterium]